MPALATGCAWVNMQAIQFIVVNNFQDVRVAADKKIRF
jgi:hypothetical protein